MGKILDKINRINKRASTGNSDQDDVYQKYIDQ